MKDSYDEKLLKIVDIPTIIDKLQEYAKCGLAANGRSHYTAKVWADKIREIFPCSETNQKIMLNQVRDSYDFALEVEARVISHEWTPGILTERIEAYIQSRILSKSEEGKNKCPKCGSCEVEAQNPATVYECGSSEYDQRLGTFHQSPQCKIISYCKADADRLASELKWHSEIHKCENPIRKSLPNPQGYASNVECLPCGVCHHCTTRAALAAHEEGNRMLPKQTSGTPERGEG